MITITMITPECQSRCFTSLIPPGIQLNSRSNASSLPSYNYLRRVHIKKPSIACQASEDGDENMPSTYSNPAVEPANTLDSLQADSTDLDAWATCKTLAQLWAIVLPVGYAGIPLASQALSDLPGGPSFAALGGEALALTAVWIFLQRKDYKLQFSLDIQSVAYGFAAGIAALVVNQILFSSGEESGATSDVAAVLLNNNPAATLALFTASTLLAPATEESIYRGFFLGSLTRLGISPMIAVGASAIAFSVAHLQPSAFLQLSVVGVCLGSAAVGSRGNILAPFIGHATYNSALFLSLLFSSSSSSLSGN